MMQQDNRHEESDEAMNIHHEGFQDNYDTLLLRLDPTPTLIKIKNSLLRRRLNPSTNEYEPIMNLPPKMSKEGVEDLMLELDSRMGIDKVLSNLDEKKINEITREVGEVVLEFIFFKADQYKIEETQWSSILNIVKHNIHIFLSRAKDGKTEDNIAKSMLFTDITSRKGNSQQSAFEGEQTGGLLSGLMSNRGRRR